LERSIAVAQENRHALAAAHGQVRPAVAIEIAHDQSTRKRHGQWQRRTEGSVAVTQKHRDAVGRQAVATSVIPSRSKSPTTTARASSPTGKSRRGENSAVWAGA